MQNGNNKPQATKVTQAEIERWQVMQQKGLGVIVHSSNGEAPKFILGFSLKRSTATC